MNMPRFYLIHSLAVLFTVVLTVSSAADLLQEVADGGVIDWGRMVIRCTGTGGGGEQDSSVTVDRDAVLAAARQNAHEKIMTTLDAMVITSDETVSDLLEDDSVLEQRVRSLTTNFREKGLHYMTDGSVEIDVELAIRGELVDLLLPPSGNGRRVADGLLCPVCGQPWPEDVDIPDDLTLKRPQDTPSEPYTGLVVDARDTNLQPALAPVLVNESGKEIYGVEFARRPRALMAGLVSYEQDVNLAAKMNRVSPRALIIKARSARGTKVVIDNEDGSLLHCFPKHMQFLSECRVIIVIK
jgi:hypothetical protein